jgi:hypothetical protein
VNFPDARAFLGTAALFILPTVYSTLAALVIIVAVYFFQRFKPKRRQSPEANILTEVHHNGVVD